MRNQILFVFSNREAKVKSSVLNTIENFSQNNQHYNARYIITQHADHLKEIVRDFSLKHGENGIIFVAGGDGSINEATNVLVNLNSATALGALPFGTANDFCKLHYSKFKLSNFLKALPNLKIAPIDVLKLTGNLRLLGDGPDTIENPNLAMIDSIYVINVASIGLDTEILNSAFHYLNKYRWLKGSAYTLAVLKHFFSMKTQEYIYSIEGKNTIIDSLLAAFCNGGFYGNGFNPAPSCDLQDGKLNYLLAPNLSRFQFAKLAVHYKNGTIETQQAKVKLGLVEKISVRAPEGKSFIGNVDGAIFSTDSFEINVVPRQLSFAFVGDYSQKMITDPDSIIS